VLPDAADDGALFEAAEASCEIGLQAPGIDDVDGAVLRYHGGTSF
jgi:hypothetical protein